MTAPTWVPAIMSTPLDGDRVRCDLCPHRCELADGAAGACHVRRNRGGRLETASFATSVAHLDPIERKPLYHVRPGSRVLTLAAPGCTFRCNYCLNHALSQYGREESVPWTARPADVAGLRARATAEHAAIGFSYAEAALALELSLALAGGPAVSLVWKTNGFLTPEAIDLIAPHLLAVNVDVKAADESAHRRLTGAALAPVFEAIERFHRLGVWIEVSTPIIPGISDEPRHWHTVAGALAEIDRNIPWHLVRFSPDFRMGRFAPTPPALLAGAAAAGGEAGLRFVYVERALGAHGRRTRCPGCDATAVERGIWRTMESAVVAGSCPRCGTDIPGRWEQLDA
ncbi:radical SAM protein [Actinoplanes aureus]|uniref:Radical SAM protein n=1 Tax=Actinoplanes aureus TaxID=2792083 RepID=A0A931C8B7_9ACTN|nr:radical SAM protein [Actinoplanes aureus]MBG0562567.1 radical SAM protein [Actinoplanes aureus]